MLGRYSLEPTPSAVVFIATNDGSFDIHPPLIAGNHRSIVRAGRRHAGTGFPRVA